ncbi:uncharacterized protein [Prorops nasuta]|uniref:uncharacterized protein n=1 Tax=Prorops nasuta TaxID=863751 RepID=UPI0034CD3154
MKPIGRINPPILLLLLLLARSAISLDGNQANLREHSSSSTNFTVSSDLDKDVDTLRNFLDDILGPEDKKTEVAEGRTFGAHKRVQFLLMPMIYKMGVMMTMLTVLTVISLKGLFVGVTLLVLKLAAFIAKFSGGWHSGGFGGQGYPQPVHVHLHGGPPQIHGPVYGAWEAGGPGDKSYYY